MGKVVMLVFPSREVMLDAVEKLNSLDYLKIKHSTIIARAEDGETLILADDVSPHEGRVAGGTLGALMGGLGIAGLGALLLPGVGPIIAIGAGALLGGVVGGATGGLSARLMDMGINDEKLDELAEHLKVGHVALAVELEGKSPEGEAVTDDRLIERVSEDLKPFQVEIVQQ
jgi:uncharacterized membrane protein